MNDPIEEAECRGSRARMVSGVFTLIPSPTCPHCQKPVLEDAPTVVCEACLATHHELCWEQGGGCRALEPGVALRPAPPPSRARRTQKPEVRRRRELLHSLQTREEPTREAVEFEDELPEEDDVIVYQRPTWETRPGERRSCRKCHRRFVVQDRETTCNRCNTSWWWKIALAVGAVIVWKVVF